MRHPVQAIIYRRFSSLEQGRGSTLARQSALCEAYIRRKGWDLVETVTDEGVSAWTGANINEGNLAKLTQRLIADGKGKVVVVEQLDRITRQPPNRVIVWLTTLTASGAALATANDDIVVDEASLATSPIPILSLVFNAYRAYSESQHKSDRVANAWEQKRQIADQKPMTGRCVAWLKLVNNAFVPQPERVATVQRIFAMALNGLGATAIAKVLNSERIDTFGKSDGWQVSYIKKILKNRAVLGEFQPHSKPRGMPRKPVGDPIPQYYPQIVSDSDFALLHSSRRTVTKSRTPRRYANLLAGLCECESCGGGVTFVSGGTEQLSDGTEVVRDYLQCERARRGLCDARRRYPYRKFENDILSTVIHAGLAASAPMNAKANELANELATAERLATSSQDRANRLLQLIEEGDETATDRYRQLIAESKYQKGRAKALKATLKAERARPLASDLLDRVRDLRSRLDQDEDARAEAKVALDRFVVRIVCLPNANSYIAELSKEILAVW